MKYTPGSFVQQQLHVIFENEQGVDGGGITREWMNLILKDVMDTRKGLFQATKNGVSHVISQSSFVVPNHLTHFRYVGRLIAKGLVDGIELEVDLSQSILKQILRKSRSPRGNAPSDPRAATRRFQPPQTECIVRMCVCGGGRRRLAECDREERVCAGATTA